MSVLTNTILPIAIIVIVIAVIMLLATGKRKNGGFVKHYDEMQLKVRGDGYRLGFFVLLIGSAVLMFLFDISEKFAAVVTPSFGIFFVLMTALVTFVVYCVNKEAFLSIGQNKKSYVILCVLIIAANGFASIRYVAQGTILEDGKLTFGGTANLICLTSFVIILIAILVKSAKDRNEVEE